MRRSFAVIGGLVIVVLVATVSGCSTKAAGTTPDAATCAITATGAGTTSADILNQQGPNCLSCAVAEGCLDPASAGGCCEIVGGNAASGGLTESALCLKTMNDIFDSKCATVSGVHLDVESVIEPGCLCGMESNECVTGSAAPMGPAYADYAADFGADAATIDQDFIGAKFGAGQANDVIECALNFDCDCFGPSAVDGGAGVDAETDADAETDDADAAE